MKRFGMVMIAALVAMAPLRGATTGVFTSGASNCHTVALTFDLCPVKSGSGFDAPLVEYLIAHRVPATFFVSGAWLTSHETELRELAAQPFFEIGTHGEAHAHMPVMSAAQQVAEITGPAATLGERFGVHAALFRPPYGEFTQDTVRLSAAAGQTLVLWSVVSGDPDPKLPAERITDEVVRRARNGSVIVFHANGRGWHTRDIVPAVYDQLITRRGFKAETVSQLRAGCQVAAPRPPSRNSSPSSSPGSGAIRVR